MARADSNAKSVTDFDGDGDGFSKMRDFGFSGSIDGPKKPAQSSTPKPSSSTPAPKAKAPAGDSGVTKGHTNPITSMEGFSNKTPANGGYEDGGAVHPHGHAVLRVEPGEAGSVTQHHEHGGYSIYDATGGVTHYSADGGEASGGDQPTNRDGGSVNAHPHGHAVTHTERMNDREIMRHSHGGFTAQYDDGRPPTHHDADGTPVYHAGASSDYRRGGAVKGHKAHKGTGHKPNKTSMPLQQPLPVAQAAPAPAPKARKASAEPSNQPPRDPLRSPSPTNQMPGGVEPYGVQPSAEPDVSQGTPGGAPMKKGGKAKSDGK